MADIEAKTEALTEAIYAYTAKMYENTANQQPRRRVQTRFLTLIYNIPDDDENDK